jgi:phenylpyruvate tautomerase PptA (4-oxalocrotonate tautomerase family)
VIGALKPAGSGSVLLDVLEPIQSRHLNRRRDSCMPLVKVNLLKGRSAEEKDSIAASIQSALVGTLEVPEADRYQLFNEYDGESLRHTSGYLGMTYTDRLLIIEITFLEGRDDELKKSLLAEINRNLVAAGVVGGDDVFVLITEIGRANVSFGKGLAQRAPASQSAG